MKKPVYGLLSSKNQMFLVPKHCSVLNPLRGGESQLSQTPAVYITLHFFHASLLKN